MIDISVQFGDPNPVERMVAIGAAIFILFQAAWITVSVLKSRRKR